MREDAGKIISKCVKSLLKKQGKTQAWLAEEMGAKAGYLSELLNDHPDKRWNADLINSAAKALKVHVSSLFLEDELAAKLLSLDDEARQDVERYLDFRLSQKSS
jgi:transcriptional regulator with XRE-family HTH domain